MKHLLFVFISLIIVLGCKEEETDIDLAGINLNDNSNKLPPPKDTITIMSYNIYEGAGTSEGAAKVRENAGCIPNSLSQLLELINFFNPDIIGIQEAVRWEANNDSIAKYVSNKLNMHYILAPGWFPEWNVMLLTKFEIVDYKLFSSDFRIGSLKARLKSKKGDTLTVYNFHLSGPEHEKDVNSFNNLINEFKVTHLGIAMGDFNEPPLRLGFPDNWRLLASGPYMGDQIWATKEIGLSNSNKYYGRSFYYYEDKFEYKKISDHFPVLFQTGLY